VVGIVDLLKESFAQQVVFDLLLGIEVHGMVVSRKLIALEKLYGSLIKLNDDDFVQQSKTLNIVFTFNYLFGQFRDLFYFALLAHKVGLQ
jgi:hypothetical protein